MGRFLNYLGKSMIILVILLSVPLALPRLLGYQAYSVVSGSMEPEIPTGSIVYSKYVEPATINATDVIVFYSPMPNQADVVVTHRVVENDIPAMEIVTKGDANDQADMSTVPYNHLIGKVMFHIPVLGRLLFLFGTASGRVAMISAVIAGALFSYAGGKMTKHSRHKKKIQEAN